MFQKAAHCDTQRAVNGVKFTLCGMTKERPALKIAIVGGAWTSKLAPYDDPSWKIWCMAWHRHQRADVLWEPHEQHMYEGPSPRPERQLWVEKPAPWEPEEVEFVVAPASRWPAFPGFNIVGLDSLLERMDRRVLDNSPAYALSYAISLRPKTIGLFGIHQRSEPEYLTERGGVLFHLGRAMGMGIEVVIPEQSPLLRSVWQAGRYGVTRKLDKVSK